MMDFKSFGSGSSGNMYTLSDGTTKIMIEAGLPIKRIKQALNFRISEIEGLLLSHIHGDHSKSIKDMVKLGVNCHMPPATAEGLKIDNHRIKPVESDKSFKIGTLMVYPFKAEHDVEAYGYLILNENQERLLFLTDSYYCRYKFKGLTHIAIEANYSLDILNQNIAEGITPRVMKKRLINAHMSLETLLDFLKANDLSKVEEIWLLHLSDTNSNEELFKREVQEITGRVVFIA
jgi:phosphoribosyl 1,2-cyclic phosphodiesterase